MKYISVILCFFILHPNLWSQEVSISASSENVPIDAFIGGSTEFMYPILEGRVNGDTSAYDSVWFGNNVIESLGPLKNNFLRFPGGTISQYYHFRGDHGYGTTDFDLDCRPGYINLQGMRQKVRVDPFYPENMIDRFIDMVRELDIYNDSDIQTLYVINLMTHFFSGDLVPWNSFLDELITQYGSSLHIYLELNPSEMDDQAMQEAVTVMNNIYRDPLIDELIEWLVQQPGFQDRLTENLEAIGYLLQNEVPVAGIELGNENYAFTMLKDDDLSNIPYDCTTPDSIVSEYGSLSLPLKTYMQAILKYTMLSSIYASLVEDIWQLPSGIVVNSTIFNVDILALDRFSISEVTTEKARYFELWNKFIGSQNFYDAVIPHIYMKSLPQCEALVDLGADSTAKFGKHYLDFYFGEVLDYQLSRIGDEVGNHPLWITEWNINTANVFGNTFLHASHCFQFMNNLNVIAKEHGILLINYHNLASWVYNQFALIRTDDPDGVFTVNLQSTYHSFKLMGELHARGDLRCDADLSSWLGDERMETPERYFYSYLSPNGDQLVINYINQSDSAMQIPLEEVSFTREMDGMVQEDLVAVAYQLEYIDAPSLFASNSGCSDYPEYFEEYTWNEIGGDAVDLLIPSYSLGKLTVDLEIISGEVPSYGRMEMKMFPNPATSEVVVQLAGKPSAIAVLELCDITGKVLGSFAAGEVTSIPVTGFSPGIYLLKLSDDRKAVSASRKLVIH